MRSMIKSIYVKERREAFVNGYIPLYTQAQNIQDESISRDGMNTTRHFSFPFTLKIKLPVPLKKRIITQRNEWGRILHSSFLLMHPFNELT